MRRALGLALCLLLQAAVAYAQIERIWLSHKSTDPGRVVVNWETAQPGNSVVRYGPTPSMEHIRAIDESATLHHVEIPLKPKAPTYYYRVQTGSDRSAVASFKGYTGNELRVAVIADLQGRPHPTGPSLIVPAKAGIHRRRGFTGP